MVPSSHKGTAEKEAHRNLHLLLAGKQAVSFNGGHPSPNPEILRLEGVPMTIKRSLILSHVSMCILPFLMTFFVLVSSFSGLYLYAKSGNHVMAESGFQFQAMSQVVRALIFHHIRHSKEALEDHWVLISWIRSSRMWCSTGMGKSLCSMGMIGISRW